MVVDDTGSLEVTFPKLNHFWLDSGLLGFYQLLNGQDGIAVVKQDNGVTLRGAEEDIRSALTHAYDALIKDYYDITTKRQRDATSSYNFYYDSASDLFVQFPKRKAVGIAKFIFDQPARPKGSKVKWEKREKREVNINGEIVKRTRGVLPPEYAPLQQRLDVFLDTHDLEVTTAVLLVDGPNEVRPKVVLGVKEGKVRGRCYLCGDEAYTLDEANQTIFPFLTGPSGVLSFNSEAGRPEKICWKCAFIGKFPPVNGFYLSTRQRDSLFAFFPYSSSFEKMCDVYRSLRDIEYIDPNYYQNFQHPLHVGKATGGFFQRPFEVAFAFFYTLYRKLLVYTEGNADSADVVFDWEKMFDITLSKAPLEFIILHAEKKGDAWIGKMVWPFRDSVYFFRLMNALEDAGVNINDVMRLLIDFSQTKNENKTLVRNRVCERILKKKTALQLVESHAFSADVNYIKPLLDFETAYEPIIRMEDEMKREEQEAAVTLGKRVGMAVGTEGKKGDLFALRKVRKKVDFLNELNRLQFKYDLSVPPDVYGGKLTDENFVEFKQFCMLAALNSFNAKQHPKGGT